MIRRSLLSAVCVAAVSAGLLPATAQTTRDPYQRALSRPQHDPYYGSHGSTAVDALHYRLRLRWVPATDTLSGTAVIRFRAARDVRRGVSLDLGNPLSVSSARLDGATVSVTRGPNKVHVATGHLARNSRHTMTIAYAGTPRPIHAPTTRGDFQTLGWTIIRCGPCRSRSAP